ncbi:SusC/RagA family TonB-linked outer membrane protein [Chitinophaga lutea]|uniref:SusC/RagA family TonB-linked outer membrane protein n=1 Tax=Chitinophaga lutea TaxID=2488634 RepID=A0A3N4PKP5_9BACT|nr:TonB-dependent receptor [Chitinophaga lutea]RPE05411.1 SusC/RagA family TonB-linked outer membrane protein [Chitinophaga lutea]
MKKQKHGWKHLLTTVWLLTAFLYVSAKGFSQAKITLQVKDVEIQTAFERIEKQSGYRILYNQALLKGVGRVSVDARDEPVRQVLDRLLAATPLGYELLDNQLVVIKRKNAGARDVRVTGKVTDAAGAPVPGATVQVKGTSTGTLTDGEGNYSINVPDNGVLIFSYIGFIPQEVVVGNQTSVNIRLEAKSQDLEQVVVVGYGTQRKRDLTGAITSVKGEEIARMPNTNPISSLQGKVAGLTVVNSGVPGAAPTVRIRGVNSTNNSNPLYVVDGVFQSNIDYLNPAEIESIEILRDPSSMAIFGLSGGNGVIVVTTKKAAKGETRVTLQSSVGLQKVNNLIDVTDANGFRKLYDEQLKNLGAQPFDYTNYTANTNWQDLVLRTAFMSNNSLNISNSSEKTTTLINLGYNTHEGVLRNGKYQRLVARLNEEIRVNKHFKMGGDVTGTHWILDATAADLNNAKWAAPIVPVQANANTYYSMPSFQRTQVSNPIARLNGADGNTINKGFRVVGSVFAELKFLQRFTWRSTFYTDLGFNNSRGYTPLPYAFINLGEGAIRTDTTINTNIKTGVNQKQEEFRKFQQDHTLAFEETFNRVHKVSAVAGFTTYYEGSTSLNANRTDTTLKIPRHPDFWYVGIVSPDMPGGFGGSGKEFTSIGFLGRVNYAYDDKYLLNVSYRRDGLSKISPANRWGNFGGVGAGWVISSEEFFKSVNVINFLKLRGSWGTIGSAQGIDYNIFRPLLTTAGTGIFGNNIYTSVAPAYIPDPNLKWEVVHGTDIGLDVRALANRLSAEINLYHRKTTDIITQVTLPGAAGSYGYKTNLGTISNKGIEITLGWNDKVGEDFSYSISPNFSYNRNRVESIGDNFNFMLLGNAGANRTITGQSIGHFFGYRQTGIYQSSADMDKMPRMSNSLPGDISFADIDGDGVITPKDRTNLGSPFPDYSFGVNVSLRYRQFDAVLEGQGVAGNYVYTQRRMANFATVNYESNRLRAWSAPGTSNVEPILDNTRSNNYLFSTYFLEPGDYFRIRTVQLGYSFGPRLLNKTGLKGCRFYLSGQNLYTFSRTTGYSPEAPIGEILGAGADNGVYPLPATYTFGLNVTF